MKIALLVVREPRLGYAVVILYNYSIEIMIRNKRFHVNLKREIKL